MKHVNCVLIVLLILSAGCGAARVMPPVGLTPADQWLFERGMERLQDRKWFTAREYFRRLVDAYPQSPHREDARIAIGDTYIGENSVESNILAIHELREVQNFFPASRRADYTQYRIALAYSRQMRHPQRDQDATMDTIREVDTFLQRYPESPLAPEVRILEREARDRASQAEYEIGYFYARFNLCAGALDRFRSLLVADPAFTRRDAVYFQIGECLLKTNKPAEARPWFERVVDEFPHSDFISRATRRMAEIKAVR
jgi:outer membrane protein assembly factor BamD